MLSSIKSHLPEKTERERERSAGVDVDVDGENEDGVEGEEEESVKGYGLAVGLHAPELHLSAVPWYLKQ